MNNDTDLYRGNTVHLYTDFGTILYLDPSGVVRHGPPHLFRSSAVCLITCGHSEQESCAAVLVAGSTGAPIRVESENLTLSENVELACIFQFSAMSDDVVFLKANGVYLCAEPGGRVSLSRRRPSAWERFKISFPTQFSGQGPKQFQADTDHFSTKISDTFRFDRSAFISREVAGGRRAVVSDMSWLKNYIVHETYHYVRLLHENHGFDIIDSQHTLFRDRNTINIMNEYEMIFLCYQDRADVPANLFKPFTILKIDDLENYDDRYTDWLKRTTGYVDLLVSPYAYEVGKFFPHNNIGWTPYSSAIEHEGGILPFNDNPIEMVFASGSVADDRPFRKYVFSLDDDRIAKLGHPGYQRKYDDDSTDIVKGKWYRELNRYLAAFCDAHSLRYIHPRVFEIASTGALLIADRLVELELNQLGMVDGETCIFADQSDFLDKVSWILDDANRAAVDRIRRAGMKLTLERHLTRHKVASAVELFEERLRLQSNQ